MGSRLGHPEVTTPALQPMVGGRNRDITPAERVDERGAAVEARGLCGLTGRGAVRRTCRVRPAVGVLCAGGSGVPCAGVEMHVLGGHELHAPRTAAGDWTITTLGMSPDKLPTFGDM
jgi:hypothetical protein